MMVGQEHNPGPCGSNGTGDTGAVSDPHGQTTISVLFQVFATHFRLRTLLNRTMAGAPLRPDEYAVYSAVRLAAPVSVSDLARMVGMPLTTASDYVQAMTRRGHADRVRNPADNRSYLLTLTPAGNAAHAATRTGFADAMKLVREALDMPEQDIARALTALDGAIRQALTDEATPRRTDTG